MKRYIKLIFLSAYHFLGIGCILLFFPIAFFLTKKKKILQNNDIIVLSSVAISYDGRIRKSLAKLQEYFSSVFLIKPRDALENTQLVIESNSQNVKILLHGHSGSYTHFPYCFDISIFLYLFFSKASYIYCHDIQTCFMGFLISRLRRKVFIADLHEWMSETVEISKDFRVLNLPSYKRLIYEVIERLTLKHAAHVITVSEMLSQLMKQKYNINRDIIVIKNTGSIKIKIKKEKKEKLKGIYGGINLLYFGQIHAHRNIENLLYGLVNCDGFNLWLQGTCPPEYKSKLMNMITNLDLKQRVTFLNPVWPEDAINAIKKADVGIMSCKTFSKNLKNSLPNKVFEYIYAEIPFICETLPSVQSMIGTCSFVKYFDSNFPGSFTQTLKSIDETFLNSIKEIKYFKKELFHYDDFDNYKILRK